MGVSVPLTGSQQPEGTEDGDAVITSVVRWKEANGERIKGHEIELRMEDDGCTEEEITMQAARRLIDTPGLIGVIGPDCSTGARAALPLYEGAGVVAISGSATDSDLASTQPPGGFFFRTAYRNSFQGLVGGLFVATELGATTAYLIDDGETYGIDLINAAEAVMREQGIAVSRDTAPLGTVDFGLVVQRIMEAEPDFVGFASFNPDVSLLYRQLRDAGYAGEFGAGDAAASVQTFVEPVGRESAEGVYFVGCPLTLPEDFLADFERVHGDRPDASAFVAQYADAATLLLDAVARVAEEREDGSLVIDRAALRDAVSAGELEDGLSGRITFDEHGDRSTSETDLTAQALDFGVAACQVQGGRLVNLFP
ncbi:MAG: branched-chain amino acid ABC transporter substrate-binding protein [Dehalococcoidia bacterium]|nr:branched-chain amino acid ABC transporter substrate-binding protein [Dehalococcoidia bacterium]